MRNKRRRTLLVVLTTLVSMAIGIGSADAGLVAHWKLNEGSGATAEDSMGHNDGTLNGSPSWVPGKFGNAVNFSGSADYVNIGDNSSLQTTGDLTISLWLKPRNIGVQTQSPMGKCFYGEYSLSLESGGALRLFFGTKNVLGACPSIPNPERS